VTDDARDAFLADLRARATTHGVPLTPRAMTRAALDADDVTGDMRRSAAVLSMGNACEAHGPALAPDIDDRTGAAVAIRVACATGVRYLGHVPYATDGIGDLARDWSPAYLPFDDFYERTSRFVTALLRAFYDEAGAPRPKVLAFVSGHGGNGPLARHLPRLARDLGVERCLYSLSMRVPIQHADGVEHSVARALGPGCVNDEAIRRVNESMRDDASLFETMAHDPAVSGMAGFYVFGDARFDAVRGRYPGVKASVAALVGERRIDCDKARGEAVLEASITAISSELLDAARALGLKPPWFAR
jgi:creatinine amidohydrolase/Fe(II)-dependent formamide hydrolase-like protein